MGSKRALCLPVVLVCWLVSAGREARAEEAVDAAVVLMIDASGSTGRSTNAFNEQVTGFAEAMASSRVQAAIRAGFHGRVAVVAAVRSAAPAYPPRHCTGWTVIATGRRTPAATCRSAAGSRWRGGGG